MEIVRHRLEIVRHKQEIVRHRPELVRHRQENLRHRTEMDRHRPETVRHRPEIVRHRLEIVRHRPEIDRHRAYNAGIDLLSKINNTSCFLALLQEPYCYKGTLAAIPSRADFITTIRTGGPRAAIYADKRLKIREVAHLCTRDLAVGVCVIGKKQTLVISAYMDIIQNIRKDTLVNILEYRQAKRLGLILAMDSNAHSTLWGQ